MQRHGLVVFAALAVALASGTRLSAEEKTAGLAPAVDSVSRRDTAGYEPPAWPEPPDTGAMLARLAAGTMSVLVLCAGTLWVGRRWLRGGPSTKAGIGQLRLVETVSLGNRAVVHLLAAGNQRIVVGTDSSGLKSLIALPESFSNSLVEAQSNELPSVEAGAVAAGHPQVQLRIERV